MARNTQHVVRHPEGGWSVKKGGSAHVTRRFKTQQEAISFAQKLSKHQGAELYIHGPDGMVRSKASYAGEPRSSRERKPVATR
jgi:pterin-4a-carbinolamine dehydratase